LVGEFEKNLFHIVNMDRYERDKKDGGESMTRNTTHAKHVWSNKFLKTTAASAVFDNTNLVGVIG
jgi:hypothetical protein